MLKSFPDAILPPLISVVVITYNSALFITDTLSSIAKQTYPNVELVITDDASKDNTVEIVKSWIAENRQRFNVVRLLSADENAGVSANFLKGIEAAKGEWIKVIAGDDILLPSCISSMYTFCSQNKYSIAFSGMYKLQNGRLSKLSVKPELKKFFTLSVKQKLLYYVVNPIFLNPPSGFFRSEIFRKYDLVDSDFKLLEDQPLYINALKNGIDMGFLGSEELVGYRVNEDSITRSVNPRFYDNLYRSFRRYRSPLFPDTMLFKVYKISVGNRLHWLSTKFKNGNRIHGKIDQIWKDFNDRLSAKLLNKTVY